MAEVDMNLNLYSYNKSIMKQMPIIEDLSIVKEKLYKFMDSTHADQYLMLLCREKADYTLFNFDMAWDPLQFAEDIIECMNNRGLSFVDISLVDDDQAVEIWVKEPGQMEDANMYYLFNADDMVITY